MAQKFHIKAKSANRRFPYNPYAVAKDPFHPAGSSSDDAQYIQPPGTEFYQPYIAVPNGPAFIWPLGVEGFSNSISPTVATHKYIGDNHVEVNVVHRGEEHVTLNGNFIGDTAVDSMSALKAVVYAVQPAGGKILYLPGIFAYAQRVAIGDTSFDHGADERGGDLTYSIEFYRIGIAERVDAPDLADPTPQPTSGKHAATKHVFKSTAKVNTLRRIAALKLGSVSKWDRLYTLNEKLFVRLKVPKHKAPDYHLKIGTSIYF
jgi:hypothetical protein